MKHIFALGTVMLSGALLAGACVANDSDDDPDTTENFGGAGGTGGSDGGSGGSSTTTTTATTDNGGSGGTSTSGGAGGWGGSGGSGGTYASGGSAGDTSNGAGGWAGDDATTGEETTTTTSTTGNGGSGGACLGNGAVEHVPDCEDLEFAHVVCDYDPPEPFGMTHCKQFAEHAKPEVFKALFDCLDAIDVIDACSVEHDDAVRLCRDGNLEDEDESNDGVIPLTCESDLAREKCANLGCPEVDTELDGECDVYLSAFTPAGVDHVITCTNEFTGDVEGGEWGAGPDTTGCGEEFRLCVIGVNQPVH